MAAKKSSSKRRRRPVSKGRGRASKPGPPSLKKPRKDAAQRDINNANADGVRGQVVAHVQGALRSLLGHALDQMNEWQGFDAQQEGELFSPDQAQKPLSSHDPALAPVASAVDPDAAPAKQSPSVPDPLVTDQDLIAEAKAKALLKKLREMSKRGEYTVLRYLEELGKHKAFDGRPTDMNKLPGKNLSTTRKRIWELITEQAVSKDPKSSKIQRISLTDLGKAAYRLHIAAVQDPGIN
ncbi:MAG: hypothetical protein ACKOFX_08055 [Solirubrobacterales bacterium]